MLARSALFRERAQLLTLLDGDLSFLNRAALHHGVYLVYEIASEIARLAGFDLRRNHHTHPTGSQRGAGESHQRRRCRHR